MTKKKGEGDNVGRKVLTDLSKKDLLSRKQLTELQSLVNFSKSILYLAP